MPRRYYNYLDQFQPLHAFSTYRDRGCWVGPVHHGGVSAGVAAQADGRARTIRGAERRMEWETSSPPITHNFEEQPVLEHEPYDYRQRKVNQHV